MEYHVTGSGQAFDAGTETAFTGTAVTTIGGSLNSGAAAGDLVLIGVAENAVAGTTFTAGSGITTLVGFANQTNGTASMCVGEKLSCAASPAANITISPSNNVAATAIAFNETTAAAANPPLVVQQNAIIRASRW